MARAELTARLGDSADATLARLGLVSDIDAKTVAVRVLAMLTAIEELAVAGMDLDRLVDCLVEVMKHQHKIADLLLQQLRRRRMGTVRQLRLHQPGWRDIAEISTRARTLAITVLSPMMQNALDDVSATIMPGQADKTTGKLDASGRNQAS